MSKTEIAVITVAIVGTLAGFTFMAYGIVDTNYRKGAGQIQVHGWVNAEDASAVLEALKRGAERPKSALAAGEGGK